MKITKQYLKQVIKEEIQKITETEEISQDFIKMQWEKITNPNNEDTFKIVKTLYKDFKKPGGLMKEFSYLFNRKEQEQDKKRFIYAGNLNKELFAACLVGLMSYYDTMSQPVKVSQQTLYKTLFGEEYNEEFMGKIEQIFYDIIVD